MISCKFYHIMCIWDIKWTLCVHNSLPLKRNFSIPIFTAFHPPFSSHITFISLTLARLQKKLFHQKSFAVVFESFPKKKTFNCIGVGCTWCVCVDACKCKTFFFAFIFDIFIVLFHTLKCNENFSHSLSCN